MAAAGEGLLHQQQRPEQLRPIFDPRRLWRDAAPDADRRVKMTEGSDSYYVAVPAWHSFLSEALPLLGHETWYSPPAGLVFAWDNYYLPGTAPFTPPEAQSSPAPSSGGHHRKKKH